MVVLFKGKVIAHILDELLADVFHGMLNFDTSSDKKYLFIISDKDKLHFFETLDALNVNIIIGKQ